MRPRLLALLPLFLLTLALATPATAAANPCDRYASPGGSVQRLVDSLRPGQTGCLRDGTYDDTEDGYIARFGEPRVALRSAPGEHARIVGIVMVAPEADRVRISGLSIEGTGDHNTVKIYATRVVVRGNDITNRMRGDSCMMLGSDDYGRAIRPVVRDNVFHDCGATAHDNLDHAIYAASVVRGRIVDNVFSNSAAYSIQLYPNAQRTRVARNVIDGGRDTVRGGIVIGGDDDTASRGNVVERNVITHTPWAGVYSYWSGGTGRGNVVRDNCMWATEDAVDDRGGLVVGRNAVADPRFRDRTRGDYRLGDDSRCVGVLGRAAAAIAAHVSARL
jgi:hypothetical protein